MDMDTCAPLEGVMVDFWYCFATERFSILAYLSFDIIVSKIPGREVQYYVYQTLLFVARIFILTLNLRFRACG